MKLSNSTVGSRRRDLSVNFAVVSAATVTTLRSALDITNPSVVCLSVRVADARTQTVELFRNNFTPYCSLAIWLDCEQNSEKIFATVSQGGGCYIKGVEKLINISLYLVNDTKY